MSAPQRTDASPIGGVPWSTLYCKANDPRPQRIKARWDPRNVFRHAMSIRMG
jgi:hypothetical protein